MTQIILFAASLVALVAFFAIKLFENKHQRVFFSIGRKKIDIKIQREFDHRKMAMPKVDLDGVLHFLHDVLHNVAVGIHGVVLLLEKGMSKAVSSIRGRRDEIKTRSTSSEFLMNVAKHKDNLKRPERRLPE
ncbi:MAG: hypothetical protein ISR99_02290 [Parcubacteria group bacterium]|nr:hypothetical protein [Parcubacteria group bacterium]